MSNVAEALRSVPSLCQSCGKQGRVRSGLRPGKEPFCACPAKKLGGPYAIAPGHVVRVVFESADDAAFREECRLAGNAFLTARDGLSARWVRCGKGWRELPRGNPKRERLERAYSKAKRAQAKLQARCPHTHRSMFSDEHCDVCHACLVEVVS